MLVENQYISVVWNRVNKKYYTNKGYIFTAYGDEFYVKAEDLTKSSHEKVRVVCDCCSNEYEMLYVSYWKQKQSESRRPVIPGTSERHSPADPAVHTLPRCYQYHI